MTSSCPSGDLTTQRKRRGEDEYSITINKRQMNITKDGNSFLINAKLYPPIAVDNEVNPYLTLKGASVKATTWSLHKHPNVYSKPFIILVEYVADVFDPTQLRYAYYKGFFDPNRLYSFGSSDNADTYANAIGSKEMDGAERYYLYVPQFDVFYAQHLGPLYQTPLVSETIINANVDQSVLEKFPTYESVLQFTNSLANQGYFGETNNDKIDQGGGDDNFWAKDRRMIRNVFFTLNDITNLTEISFDVMTHINYRTSDNGATPITELNFDAYYNQMVLSGTTPLEFISQQQFDRAQNLTVNYTKSIQVYFPPGMAEIFGFRDNPIPSVERNTDPQICPHTFGPAPNARFTDDFLFDPFWYAKDNTMYNIGNANIPRGGIFRTRFSCTSSDPGLPLHFTSQLKLHLVDNRENAYQCRADQIEKSDLFSVIDIPVSAVNARVRTEMQDYLPLKISSEKTITKLDFRIDHFNSEGWNADVFSMIEIDFDLYLSLYV